MIFNNLKLMVYSNAAKTVPGLTKLLMSITPKEVLEQGTSGQSMARGANTREEVSLHFPGTRSILGLI